MRDLRCWAMLSPKSHVGHEVWPVQTAAIFTDASMRDWGAIWNVQVPACGFFDAAQEGSRVNDVELLAAVHLVCEFVSFARGQQLQHVSDSRVTVHVV
jgi:hypothetical protein